MNVARPNATPARTPVARAAWYPTNSIAQSCMGLSIPTIMDGTMVSMEPNTGAARTASTIWMPIAAAIPRTRVMLKFHSRAWTRSIAEFDADPTIIRNKASASANSAEIRSVHRASIWFVSK